MRFSANLGLLWADLPLADAIRAAKAAGFHAVECHWPYDQPLAEVQAALSDTGLPMLGLNTAPGDVAAGDFGLSALPGREAEARAAIETAVHWGAALGARHLHVMAGRAGGARAEASFRANLAFACDLAAGQGMAVLIEPLNPHDAPGYFLHSTGQARTIIEGLARPNLRLMFDCYHVARTEGDVIRRLEDLLPIIGHIQIAAVPDRGAPDHGTLDHDHLFGVIDGLGWTRPIGAEYRPAGRTEDSLGWLEAQL